MNGPGSDGATEVDGDEVDGDEVDGDEVDGDEVDGDEVDGDEVDGVEVDGVEVDADTDVDGELLVLDTSSSSSIVVTTTELVLGEVLGDVLELLDELLARGTVVATDVPATDVLVTASSDP